jgi:hypothetical protein
VVDDDLSCLQSTIMLPSVSLQRLRVTGSWVSTHCPPFMILTMREQRQGEILFTATYDVSIAVENVKSP